MLLGELNTCFALNSGVSQLRPIANIGTVLYPYCLFSLKSVPLLTWNLIVDFLFLIYKGEETFFRFPVCLKKMHIVKCSHLWLIIHKINKLEAGTAFSCQPSLAIPEMLIIFWLPSIVIIRREVLYNFLVEFSLPMKLLRLITMCSNNPIIRLCR
jgi:hypothetical protein